MGDQQNLLIVRFAVIPAGQITEELVCFGLLGFRNKAQRGCLCCIGRLDHLRAGIAVEIQTRHVVERRNAERVDAREHIVRQRHHDQRTRRAGVDERLLCRSESHDRKRAERRFFRARDQRIREGLGIRQELVIVRSVAAAAPLRLDDDGDFAAQRLGRHAFLVDHQPAGRAIVGRLAGIAAVAGDLDFLPVDVQRPVGIVRIFGGVPAREGERVAENVSHAGFAPALFGELDIVFPGRASGHGWVRPWNP